MSSSAPDNRRCFSDLQVSREAGQLTLKITDKVDNVQVPIPRQLTESRIVRPTEIAAAPAKPMGWDFERLDE